MAFPNLLKRLFDSNGAGVKLNGGIMPYSTSSPKAASTASPGTSDTVARGDHIHPAQTAISGNAGTATKLKNKRTIDGVQFDGSANVHHYGSCSTAAGTAEKAVTLAGFTLATGARITVRFTVTNTAANPTLNVNSTGAKPIQYRNAAISAAYLAANRVYEFVYDGAAWELVGDINTDTNTTYGAASAAPKAPGTAAVGTSAKYAREDHVHPLQTSVTGSSGSCTGNAGSSTKLATARTVLVNLASTTAANFDGTANITPGVSGTLPAARGGTGRTDGKVAALATARKISLTGAVTGNVTFDGSKNVSIATAPGAIAGVIPIGGIIAFSGTFGGTGNRFPIPLGGSTPDTNWCLCDGTTTNGKTVPNLKDRMIMGAGATYKAGTTGGAATHTHSLSGTVGATTLTVAQMPSHTHTFSKGTYGDIAEATGSANSGKQTTDATGGSASHTHGLLVRVLHMSQGQALRRGRGAGQGAAVGGLKDGGDLVGAQLVTAAGGQQSGHVADHLLQKTVGRDGQAQAGQVGRHELHGRQFRQCGGLELAHRAFHLGARVLEAGEVMPAQQKGQGRAHGPGVQGAAAPDEGRQPGRHEAFLLPEVIHIGLAQGADAGMEVGGGLLPVQDAHVRRQQSIEGVTPVQTGAAGHIAMGHLTVGMDARIGATGAEHAHGAPGDAAHGGFHGGLHGGRRRGDVLDLPAAVTAAVIGQQQPETHGGRNVRHGGFGVDVEGKKGGGAAARPGDGQVPARKSFSAGKGPASATLGLDAGEGRFPIPCRGGRPLPAGLSPGCVFEGQGASGEGQGPGKGPFLRHAQEVPFPQPFPPVSFAMMPSGGRRG